ncbi:MAG: DMT family transporter [Nocardioidaceae bacterium]
MLVAVLAALGSAVGFAASTSLQHQAAGSVPPASSARAVQLLAHLATSPRWLLGQLAATISFVLHAVALHAGPLAVVQPIVVSGIVFAVPMRAALNRRTPMAHELVGVSLTAVGLGVFVIAARPTLTGDGADDLSGAVLTAADLVVAAACVFLASRTAAPRRRGFWLGVAAGTLFGLVAGLLKLSLLAASGGGIWAMSASWSTAALMVTGAFAITTNLRAYQAAELSASMPALNIIDVLVALGFGFAVFGEIPAHGPAALIAEVMALGCISIGLRNLARQADAAYATHPHGRRPTSWCG